MLERMLVITNNPMARDALSKQDICEVQYAPVSYRQVLCMVRDAIHQGHSRLTPPLSGSVKPGETPYKSGAVSQAQGLLDLPSLSLIENSIATCDKFPIRAKSKDPSLQADFQTIDLTLIQSIF